MTSMFTRILLATERTEFDAGSERVTLAMAQRCQIPLSTVFPLLSNPEYEALAPQIAQNAERGAAEKIAQLRGLAQASGVSMDIRLRRGEEPYREIVQEARERQAQLIVIRRRGKRGFLANLLVGEMVSKVVAHAPCHVLIVPRQSVMWTQGVLAPVEPGAAGMIVVKVAATLAAECQLPLNLVCVVAGQAQIAAAQAFVQQAAMLAQSLGAGAQSNVRVGEPYKEILALCEQTQADLIVMGRRSVSKTGRAWVGGVAQKVMGLAERPVLVLNLDSNNAGEPA